MRCSHTPTAIHAAAIQKGQPTECPITTLDFNDIQRIEVLKGAAPVMYGATSFFGVVQAIHYPAGEASDEADLAFGTYGSVRGSASLVPPQTDAYRQSLAINGRRLGFADAREVVSNEHVLYRQRTHNAHADQCQLQSR